MPNPSTGRALLAVALGLFIALLDGTIANIALPAMIEDFDIDVARVSWVLNAYNLAFVALLLPAGKLADRFGRRRLYVLGLLGFVVFSAACALAPNAGYLIAARAMQGVAGALLVPSTLALVIASLPPHKLAGGIAAWGAIGALASALGPALGGLLLEGFSWRWIFWINLPVGALAVILAYTFVAESRDRQGAASRPDILGAATIAGALLTLTLALTKGQDWGWSSPQVLVLFTASGILVGAFFFVELTVTTPMVDLALFRNRTFTCGNLVVFAAAFAMISAVFLLPVFLVSVSRFSELDAALAVTPTPLTVMIVGGFLAPRLSNRFGARIPAAIGIALAALALLLLSDIHAGDGWREQLLPMVVLGAGIGLSVIPAGTAAAAAVDAHQGTGVASGILAASRQMGIVLGVAVLVAALNAYLVHQTPDAKTQMRSVVETSTLPPPLRHHLIARIDQAPHLNDPAFIEALTPEKAGSATAQLQSPTPHQRAAVRSETHRIAERWRAIVEDQAAQGFSLAFPFGAAGVLGLGLIPALLLGPSKAAKHHPDAKPPLALDA